MTTGQKIAKCRKDMNLTQENLAGMLGVSRQAVSRWESDLAFPETDNLAKMSKLFGVTADYLLNYGNEGKEDANSSANTEKLNTGINFWCKIKNFHFEYKSKNQVGNLPLVHINIGAGRTAKGVFAIGLKSKGIVSVGLLSCGILSAGLLSFGLISFGSLALGLLSAGTFAAGIIALGATVAKGRIFSATIEYFEELKEDVYLHLNKIPAVFSLFTSWCREIFNNILNGSISLGGA